MTYLCERCSHFHKEVRIWDGIWLCLICAIEMKITKSQYKKWPLVK